MVDLSKAKAGDVVKFRCGGSATIQSIEPETGTKSFYWLSIGRAVGYGINGTYGTTQSAHHPFDIIEIIPKSPPLSIPKAGDKVTIEIVDGRTELADCQMNWFRHPDHIRRIAGRIISIEPKAFDWATVKPGQAFYPLPYSKNEIAVYIGKSFYGSGFIFQYLRDGKAFFPCDLRGFIRAHELDIGVTT